MVGRGDPFTRNIGSNWQRWSEIVDFLSIFARSASGVIPSEKVQLKLIGSPLRAFQWAQDEHRTLSLSPQKGLKNASVQNLNCDNSENVRDTMSLTINHKYKYKYKYNSYFYCTPYSVTDGALQKSLVGSRVRAFDWYRPRWPWVTLNGVIAFILRFFHRIR